VTTVTTVTVVNAENASALNRKFGEASKTRIICKYRTQGN